MASQMKKRSVCAGILGLVLFGGTSVYGQEGADAAKLNWQRNLIVNSSFEDGVDGWSITLGARQEGEEIRSSMTYDTESAHDGHQCLRLSGGDETTLWVAVQSDPVAVRENQYYKLSAWMRVDGVRRAFHQYLNSNVYVQFFGANGEVVNVGPSPVRGTQKLLGTQDWTEVSVVVKAPEGAVIARVGAALTCTGTAWFDQISLFESADVKWHKKETRRFTYFYEGDVEVPDKVLEQNDRTLESIEGVLGMKHPTKIRYYKYDSVDRKEALTGDAAETHYRADEIHSIHWSDPSACVGVVLYQIGHSTPMFGNGITAYVVTTLRHQNVHAVSRDMARDGSALSVIHLNDPMSMKLYSPQLVQAVSSSFVGFLIEKYGMKKFLRTFEFKSGDDAMEGLDGRLTELYGHTLGELESEWYEYLKALPDK